MENVLLEWKDLGRRHRAVDTCRCRLDNADDDRNARGTFSINAEYLTLPL
jgi:hypothetical protein